MVRPYVFLVRLVQWIIAARKAHERLSPRSFVGLILKRILWPITKIPNDRRYPGLGFIMLLCHVHIFSHSAALERGSHSDQDTLAQDTVGKM